MEKNTNDICRAEENVCIGDASVPAEKNGWMFCGLPKNGAEWDWRSAVAAREEEKE